MAGQIADKTLRHVSLCVSDLSEAKAFYGDVLGLGELSRLDLGIPGAWLSVGGDLQLHLLGNPERAAAGADHRLSIADPHALWINDVLSLVEDLRGKGLEVLENRPSGAPFQQAFVKDSDGNMVEFIGPGISWTNYVCISVERPKGVALAPLWRSHGCDRGRRSRWRCLMNWLT